MCLNKFGIITYQRNNAERAYLRCDVNNIEVVLYQNTLILPSVEITLFIKPLYCYNWNVF